jgi:hypothetical protein
VAHKNIGTFTSYGGYAWAKKSGKLSGAASTTKHKTLSKAMKACLSNSKCKGVTKSSSTVYRENTGSTVSSASGKTAYIKGDAYKLANNYYWTEISDVKLTGFADKKTYKTLSKARTACAKKSTCNGVTYYKAKKYRINTGGQACLQRGH